MWTGHPLGLNVEGLVSRKRFITARRGKYRETSLDRERADVIEEEFLSARLKVSPGRLEEIHIPAQGSSQVFVPSIRSNKNEAITREPTWFILYVVVDF